MKRILNAIFILTLLLTCILGFNQNASADSVFDKSKSNLEGTNLTSSVAVTNMTLPERIGFFLNAAYATLGALAAFLIVWAGSKWIFSGGDTAKIKKARDQILYSVAGIFVILSAYLLTTYIIARIPALPQSNSTTGPSAPLGT